MKKRINKDAEKERELERRILSAGIPIPSGTEKQEIPALKICQDCAAYESSVFDINGGTGLVLPIKIISRMPVLVLTDFHVDLPRCAEAWFRLIEESNSPDWRHYEFHGRSALKFNRDEVIKRYVTDGNAIRVGYPVRGLLLAFSSAPMPDDIRRGERLQGSIRIYDQFEDAHGADISLCVERDARWELQQLVKSDASLAQRVYQILKSQGTEDKGSKD